MYYLKARSELDGGACADDYFETGPDGVVMRLVSHVAGVWWHSADCHGEEIALADLDPTGYITPEEFEHAWHLACVSGSVARPVAPLTA
jgi:hypothetical protein